MFRKARSLIIAFVGAAILSTTLLWSSLAVACSSQPFIASMCPWPANFAPRGWAFAHGQLLQISQYQALFSLLGTTYGGDGRTTFALPDTRSRTLVGAGRGLGLSDYKLGVKGGVERVTLTVNELPAHNHTATSTATSTTTATLRANSAVANEKSATGHSLADGRRRPLYQLAAPNVDMIAGSVTANTTTTVNTTTGMTGGNQPHENRMPHLALNYIIALEGVYPSRN